MKEKIPLGEVSPVEAEGSAPPAEHDGRANTAILRLDVSLVNDLVNR
jgi:hypothetical protein